MLAKIWALEVCRVAERGVLVVSLEHGALVAAETPVLAHPATFAASPAIHLTESFKVLARVHRAV